MLTILVLFVGLTLATAVIAYWSDNLGKKLGKKRVSLWGMRPRTTATFLTIASSWLIMIFTLGVMLAIFPPLRQSLLKYDQAVANEGKLKKSAGALTVRVGNLNGQLTALRDQTQMLRGQVEKASGKLSEVQAQLNRARKAATNARSAREAAQTEANLARQSAASASKRQQQAVKRETAARENLGKVRAQLGATRQQRQQAQAQLQTAQAELGQANARVQSANARVQSANARVQSANAKVTQATNQLVTVQTNLVTVQTNLVTVQTALSETRQSELVAKANERASKANAAAADARAEQAKDEAFKAGNRQLAAEDNVAQAAKKVAELEAQRKQLESTNEDLVRVNARISGEADVILSSNIRVPVGRTLVARSFEDGLSFSEARESLRALFKRTSEQIVPGLLPGARLQLAPRLVPLPKEQESAPDVFVDIRDDEIYNNLATTISRSQNALSVRLVSERNHLEGEKTLYSRFIVVPVRPALPANDALVSAVFDHNDGDAQLFSALLKLVEAGREVAGQSGVTPPLSPEVPDFYALGSNERIFEALRKISALDGPARVTLVTSAPISTADQLSVRFKVEPASAPVTVPVAPIPTSAPATETARARVGKSPA